MMSATFMGAISRHLDRHGQDTRLEDRLFHPGHSFRSGTWTCHIEDSALCTLPFCWAYTLKAVRIGIEPDAGGCIATAATWQQRPGAVAMEGLALNMYELLNSSTNADGIDPTGLPGSYQPRPAVGFVRCWHERLVSGKVVIMFAKEVRIDGAC